MMLMIQIESADGWRLIISWYTWRGRGRLRVSLSCGCATPLEFYAVS